MIERMNMGCGEIHFPTLIVCCGCLFPLFIPHSEISGMTQEKWAVAGVVILLLFCVRSIRLGKPFVTYVDRVLKTFLIFGVVEIVIAILQSFRILFSYNSYFRFTGSFDNPAILAMLMSICLPICLFYTIKSTEKKKKIWCLLALSVSWCLLLTESRTCIIAGICSSFIIILIECRQIRSYLSNKKVWLPALGGCVILLIALYFYKRDSADGRTLLWAVSLKMITEKPLLGWGADGFSASYMPHQAAFLLQHPESKLAYLADNASHPFNEFLLFGINYGLIGLVVVFFLLGFFLRMIVKIKNTQRSLSLSIFITLVILSMFSYPYMIPMIWLVSTFLVCSVVCACCAESTKMRMPMILLLFSGISWIIFQNRHICDEWQWKQTQISSASTKTIYQNYAQLYKNLRYNPSFMYNYGAWLHHNGFYQESLKILAECKNRFDDYNVELLIADNHRQLGNTKKAIAAFEYANAMIPSRFLPLYHEMLIYKDNGHYTNACRIARKIINKPIKIKRSSSVRRIIQEAEEILSLHAKGKR